MQKLAEIARIRRLLALTVSSLCSADFPAQPNVPVSSMFAAFVWTHSVSPLQICVPHFSRWLFRDADAFFFFFASCCWKTLAPNEICDLVLKKKKNWQAKEKYVSSFQPCKLIQPAFVKTSLLIIKISLYFWRTGRHLVSKYFLLYNSKLIFQLTNHRLFLGGAVSLLGAYSSSSLAPPMKLPLLRHFFPP